MSGLAVTYGGCEYWDRTGSLMNGSIRPAGIDLNYIVVTLYDLFRRMARNEEFDVAEMSMSTFIAMVTSGDRRFVAIPVFPSRNFRHSYLFVNAAAGIDRPEDLSGRRIGVPQYEMTAALWIRAILQHDHGVPPGDMHWHTGGLRSPGYTDRADVSFPAGVEVAIIPDDRHLEGMLDSGELDALISPLRPRSLAEGSGLVRRMFPDYREAEKDYYRRTSIFPIMHTVVIGRPLYEANRWMVASLFEAFELAKRRGRERLLVTGPLAVGLPWVPADLEEIDEVFAGNDPWAYGIEPNQAVLEAMTQYSFEQGLSPRRVALEEIFAEEEFVPPTIGEAA